MKEQAIPYQKSGGYFLMMDPAYADRIFADDAFSELQPVEGES